MESNGENFQKNCKGEWVPQPDYVKSPGVSDAAAGIVFSTPTAAINAGNAVKKEVRDEALAKCCEQWKQLSV